MLVIDYRIVEVVSKYVSAGLCIPVCVSGWSGRAAGGDGGDARQLPGGGGLPAAGAAEGAGPLKQELPHPAIPPAKGGAEEPAGRTDRPRGRRAAPQSGAGLEGLWECVCVCMCVCVFVFGFDQSQQPTTLFPNFTVFMLEYFKYSPRIVSQQPRKALKQNIKSFWEIKALHWDQTNEIYIF